MGEYFAARLARDCREPVADDVSDKERADFCGYFQARPGAYRPRDDAAIEAQRQLDAVFGANTDRGLTSVPGNAQPPSEL